MDVTFFLLRLVHIFSGVFWAGTSFFILTSLQPAVRASGPEGGKFMQNLAGAGRLTQWMGMAAALTSLSGLLLFGLVSGRFNGAWLATGRGLILTVGSLAGLTAWAYGFLVIGRSSMRLAALGRQIQAVGGPPEPGLLTEMQFLQARQARGTVITTILLMIALTGMATAEAVWF